MGGRNWGSLERVTWATFLPLRKARRVHDTIRECSLVDRFRHHAPFARPWHESWMKRFFLCFFHFPLPHRDISFVHRFTRGRGNERSHRASRKSKLNVHLISLSISLSLSLYRSISIFSSISRVLNDKSPMQICEIAAEITRWKFARGQSRNSRHWFATRWIRKLFARILARRSRGIQFRNSSEGSSSSSRVNFPQVAEAAITAGPQRETFNALLNWLRQVPLSSQSFRFRSPCFCQFRFMPSHFPLFQFYQ